MIAGGLGLLRMWVCGQEQGLEGSTELRSYLRATEVISGQTQVELTWP